MCLLPIKIKNNLGDEVEVPCSKCPKCRARRISSWSFRLMQEDKVSESAHFITLTYGNTHVPITNRGFMSLAKDDVQKFFKRLRKQQDKLYPDAKPIRYYLAGEYGDKRKRPHYHAIMFNAKLELIQPAWQKGEVYYGTVSEASVGYTMKYISKPSQIPMHKNDDRLKEFALMSKGLGKITLLLK